MNASDEEKKLKKTPLYARHIELGAKMVEFAGWSMPVKYTSIIEEHLFVREHAGIFDISHMGEFVVEGKDSFHLLQKVMTNDLNLLTDGKAQYSVMCYENGTVVDDLIYYQISREKYIVIVNASNVEKDYNWLLRNSENMDVKIMNNSHLRGRLAFQGPKAAELLQAYVDFDLKEISRFHFRIDNFQTKNGKKIECFIARTGYTGEDGFELSCSSENLIDVFNALLDSGAKPIGLGARDSLRLEMGYSLYGHEINEKITPIEASLDWVVKDKKDTDYIGKKKLLEQKKKGTERKLVGLILKEKGIMRQDYKVFSLEEDGKEIGYITSGGYSPSLKKSIALALVKSDYNVVGKEVGVKIRNRIRKAEVVKPPFYKKGT